MNFKKDLLALLAALGVLILSVLGYVALDQGLFGVTPLVPSDEDRSKAIPELKQEPAGTAYPATAKLTLNPEIKDWFTPEENDDGWDYDLFTTIDIAGTLPKPSTFQLTRRPFLCHLLVFLS